MVMYEINIYNIFTIIHIDFRTKHLIQYLVENSGRKYSFYLICLYISIHNIVSTGLLLVFFILLVFFLTKIDAIKEISEKFSLRNIILSWMFNHCMCIYMYSIFLFNIFHTTHYALYAVFLQWQSMNNEKVAKIHPHLTSYKLVYTE